MKRLSTAFNLSLMYLTPQMLNGVGQVMVIDSTEGASQDFHSKGVFSTEIFGRVGDERRNYRFGYIDIKAEIFHPLIYTSIVKLKRMYGDIMAGKTYAVWNDVEKDFIKATPAVGARTGYAFFLEHWRDIRYRESKSSTRMDMIALIEKNKDIALTSKILVMPAGLRDLEIDDYGRRSEDESNALYRRFIALSNVIVESSLTTNPDVINKPRMDMQLNFVALYELIESLIKGKKKLFLGKVASRRIFNGTRNVITAMDTSVAELGMPGAPGFNSTILGLYQYSMGTLPMTTAQVRDFLNPMFPSIDSPAQLVDPRTMQSKEVFLGSRQYDKWATNEGVEKIVGSFKEESLRNVPLMIDGHYLGLIYLGPDGTFKVMKDIRELPPERSKEHVRPLTLTDLLYLSVYRHFSKYPLFVTRYPVTGIGSIYPSRTHMRVTVSYEQRKRLDDNWVLMDDEWTAYEFPLQGAAFVNSLIPHSAHLARLGADFDGDTSSANIAYSDQAQREMESFFKTKRGYIGTDGKLLFSCNVDTVDLVMYNMTGDPEEAPAMEAYQEGKDDSFSHWGQKYNINKVFEIVDKRPVKTVQINQLAWNEQSNLDDARVEAADTSHPLIITKENGVYYVLDGNHRLKKLLKQGEKSVKVKYITEDELKGTAIALEELREDLTGIPAVEEYVAALEKEATYKEVYDRSGVIKKLAMRFVSLFGYMPDLSFQKEDVDMKIVDKYKEYPELLEAINQWVSDTDYSVLPKLEEAKKAFARIQSPPTRPALYRGFMIKQKKNPEGIENQQTTGLSHDDDELVVGKTYQFIPEKPMSFSWHEPTVKAYGDTVVTVKFSNNKARMLHITHELAYAMFTYDGHKPADDLSIFTYAECVFLPDGKPLDFTIHKLPEKSTGIVVTLKNAISKIFK